MGYHQDTGCLRLSENPVLASADGEPAGCTIAQCGFGRGTTLGSIDGGARRCSAMLRRKVILQAVQGAIWHRPLKQRRSLQTGRCLPRCIGNNHSTIRAWRKRPESARIGRIWSRFVRRMVVVFRRINPGCGPFLQGQGPQRKGSQTEWRTGRDSNPRWLLHHARFPSVCLKPLGHLS